MAAAGAARRNGQKGAAPPQGQDSPMKAVVCPRYGGPEVLELRDVPMPEPGAGEVRVQVMATSVTSGDSRLRAARFPAGMGLLARPFLGFRGPRQPILGTEIAGIVDAVGAGVTRYRAGDAVMAFPGGEMGCHAMPNIAVSRKTGRSRENAPV
jgi:NADPH:quinone reductase-like Zn-dependent oxidoreductase